MPGVSGGAVYREGWKAKLTGVQQIYHLVPCVSMYVIRFMNGQVTNVVV